MTAIAFARRAAEVYDTLRRHRAQRRFLGVLGTPKAQSWRGPRRYLNSPLCAGTLGGVYDGDGSLARRAAEVLPTLCEIGRACGGRFSLLVPPEGGTCCGASPSCRMCEEDSGGG